MVLLHLIVSLFIFEIIHGLTSPITPYIKYQHSAELKANVADLFWSVNETSQEILFELHINTTGWIALGISPCEYLCQ